MYRNRFVRSLVTLGLMVCLGQAEVSRACPFCAAIDNTISEDLRKSDVTVVAEWLDSPGNRAALAKGVPTTIRDPDDPLALRDFRVVRVYKGADLLGKGTSQVRATYRNRPEPGKVYLLFGFLDQTIGWAAALPLRSESLQYLDALQKLPPPGPERLRHFVKYLADAESSLADDAYNEFARAPYSDVKKAKPYYDRQWLLARLVDPQTDMKRLRLYCTLLGVCGEPGDAPAIETLMASLEESNKLGLDAAIACYLTLRGPAGLQPIADRYFGASLDDARSKQKAHAAILALRFHGDQEEVFSKPELCLALRRVLQYPEMADLVIPDLTRWKDWSSLPAVAQLFRSATGANAFVRVPAARFVMSCPEPEAKKVLEEMTNLDPDAVRRARILNPAPPPDTME